MLTLQFNFLPAKPIGQLNDDIGVPCSHIQFVASPIQAIAQRVLPYSRLTLQHLVLVPINYCPHVTEKSGAIHHNFLHSWLWAGCETSSTPFTLLVTSLHDIICMSTACRITQFFTARINSHRNQGKTDVNNYNKAERAVIEEGQQ